MLESCYKHISSDSRMIITILGFMMFGEMYGQETINLSGKILDDNNSVPMPFAQLSVANSTLGTVTNDDGQFQLNIPSKFRNDTLLVAFLGYETSRKRISELTGQHSEIRLKSKVVQLSEVEIVGLTPQEVIRRAVANIPANYGTDSLILTAFVRSQKFVGNKLAEFTEAVIRDFKTGYHLYRKGDQRWQYCESNIPALVKGRVVSDTTLVKVMGDVGEKAGCLACNFMNDVVELRSRTILDEEVLRYHKLSMKETVDPDDGKIYHIRYDQSAKNQVLYQGEIFIDGSTFAIMKFVMKPSYQAYDHYEKDKYLRTFSINGTPGWVADMPMLTRTVTYTKYDGYWSLSLIREEQWITFQHSSGGKKIRMGYKNDVVVTDVTRNKESLRNFRGDKQKGMNERWDEIAGRPDEQFWSGFNYLPIEEKLMKEVGEMNLLGH